MDDTSFGPDGFDRREFLKSVGLVAASGAAIAAAAGPAEAAPADLGPYSTPWDPPDPVIAGRQNIVPVPENFFIPGRFAGKTAIVTGCARGMGQLAAIRLAREGANVVGVDWLGGEGRAVIDAIVKEGGKAVFVEGDISETAVCDAMVKAAVDTFGGLDCCLNNAGVMDAIPPGEPIDYASQKDLAMSRISDASDAYWDVVMRVNATGTFRSMRAELRQMLAQGRGGSIVNVASVAGLRGFGGTPSYVASKHAVNGLTKNAAIDYAPFGIRVNSVCMGTTITPMYERAFDLLKQRAQSGYRETGIGMLKIDSLLQWSNQQKMGSMPAEQVAVMLFLLSPESSNLTGATYATDGGFTTY
ncbi:SDR family NAD(P)-dependent oxidoreductase [Tabrizicola sp. J26]|uniref:SDR family NAD(P)-dependent oxidoreductase n=1 Tax=Alitabrizicola rongguiensis TaxID=2909234 RepID=UPI001F266A68|nr:SDR family NAD(P)-dependent oxidoreductase [Tabrizicola rongguiensis]MCF1710992.1 SDR family NAD(P)-dependent oxidoreductase [Tabrizicola rongguiensis]